MRAVVHAHSRLPGAGVLGNRICPALLPILDRPVIQHVVESLAMQGVTRFDIVISHVPEAFRRALGDGRRWGVEIQYQLARDPAHPYRPVAAETDTGGAVVIAHADRLPSVRLPAAGGMPPATAFTHTGPGGAIRWSGWACVRPAVAAGITEAMDEPGLYDHLMATPGAVSLCLDDQPWLDVRTLPDYLEAQRRVLEGAFGELMRTGRPTEEGVWLGRNVNLHPTARIVPPVYVAADCRIGKGASLGPAAALGPGCVVDDGSVIENAVVFPGSYIGRGLDVRDAVVDRNCMASARLGAEILLDEHFLLGSTDSSARKMPGATPLSRIGAVLFLAAGLPVIGAIAAFRKIALRQPAFVEREVIRLPAVEDPSRWQNYRLLGFLRDTGEGDAPDALECRLPAGARNGVDWRDLVLRFLPAMINVARGDLRIVGVTPRSPEGIRALPEDWRAIYLSSGGGVIHEALVAFGPRPGADECYAAETIYSVSRGFFYDLKLLGRYLGQVFGLLPPPGGAFDDTPMA